jgi:hypothetical protein
MAREPSLIRLKMRPEGALLAKVPAPEPLSPGAVARISAAVSARKRRSFFSARSWRPAWVAASVAVGSLAFAAVSQTDVPARLRAALAKRIFRARPPAPVHVAAPVAPSPAVEMGMPTPVHGQDALEPLEIGPEELASAPNSPAMHRPLRVANRNRVHWEGPGAEIIEPSPAPAGGGLVGTTVGAEAELLSRAIKAREAGHPDEAMSLLNAYTGRFPDGELKQEAFLARIDALLDLGRRGEALTRLDALEPPEFAALPRSNELRVLRGELLVEQGRCRDALDAFGSALLGKLTAAAEERAMYGRAACQSRLGRLDRARSEGDAYLKRFPAGRHADAVHDLLGH